jgi:predicted metalloprotease with PDZ domain
MSEYAPFSDAARSVDPTDQDRSFISYYTYGAAIALALDLSLRQMSAGRQSLDDFMRLLWRRFGKPGGAQPGLVGKPYSLDDLRTALADLTGDRSFADDFFQQYVEGRAVPDFAALLERAGFALRRVDPQAAWSGVQVQAAAGGVIVGSAGRRGDDALVPFGTPAYDAGLEQGDLIRTIDGQPATVGLWNGLRQRKPGDSVSLVVVHRGGVTRTTSLKLEADPALQIADLGGSMTPEQKAFRAAWLSTKVK